MRAAWLLLLVCVAGCHGDDTSAGGTLSVNLQATSTNDGALVLLVAGGSISAVHPTSGYQVSTTVDSVGTHLIFIGNLVAGPLATIDIPDLKYASRYVAVVEQVADRSAFTLLDPSNYQVTVQAPGSAAFSSMKTR